MGWGGGESQIAPRSASELREQMSVTAGGAEQGEPILCKDSRARHFCGEGAKETLITGGLPVPHPEARGLEARSGLVSDFPGPGWSVPRGPRQTQSPTALNMRENFLTVRAVPRLPVEVVDSPSLEVLKQS